MEDKRYQIKGQIIDITSQMGIPGLRIEAWDKDLLIDDFLGETSTTEDGWFRLLFKETYYQEIFFDRRPDIYFRVFFEGEEIH